MSRLVIPNGNLKNIKDAEGTLPYIVNKYRDDYNKIIEENIIDINNFDYQLVQQKLLEFFDSHKSEMNAYGKRAMYTLRNINFRGVTGRKLLVGAITNYIGADMYDFKEKKEKLKDLSELKDNYSELN